MKKKLLLVLMGAVAFSVSSCTLEVKEDGNSNKPTTTADYVPPTTQYTTTTESYSMEDLYLDTVYSEYPYLQSAWGDSLLLEFGYLVCDSIDNGMTLQDLTLIALDAGAEPFMIGYLTGAAIPAFCAWNMWFIDSYL